MTHPVGFTDTARQDVREFIEAPERRVALVQAIITKLSWFPRAHRPCRAFGPEARAHVEGDFTVIYDVAADADERPGSVAVRHVWPSRGRLVADLLNRL